MQSLHAPHPASSTFPALPQTLETFNTASAVPANDVPSTASSLQEIPDTDFPLQNPVSGTTESVSDAAGSPEPSNTEDGAEKDIEERRKIWAGQNPTKATIPEPQKKSRKGQNTKVRKIHEDEQCERCQNMAEELKKAQEHYHQQLRDTGMKYGRLFETIVNYVSYSSRYRKQRAPSLYLAKAEEVNKGMLLSYWNFIALVVT